MYKYFTWTEQGYHRGQELYSRQQVKTLLNHTKSESECYATIQDYNRDGSAIGCPIYFDIDSSSLYDAFVTTINLCEELESEFNVEPAVWFSGSKGFHIVLPIYIRHHRCHEIMAMIASDFIAYDYDKSVYRQRSMWRCQGTWNGKGNRFKVRVDPTETLVDILKRGDVNGTPNLTLEPFIMYDLDVKLMAEYTEQLPDRTQQVLVIGDGDSYMMPCLKRLWNMDAPPEGMAHQLCHLVSRWCFKSGLERSEAVSLFMSHVFWKAQAPRDYEKVIDSVYRTGNAFIGCRSGRDADLLKTECQLVCHFNEDFKLREVFGDRNME